MKRIVLLAGFEAFNASLYRQAAEQAMTHCVDLEIAVFSDRDLGSSPEAVSASLAHADAFFASLIFDFDQVEWLRQHAAEIPIRVVFESAIELMALTCFGRFSINPTGAVASPVRSRRCWPNSAAAARRTNWPLTWGF